jgi:hypothetical protein
MALLAVPLPGLLRKLAVHCKEEEKQKVNIMIKAEIEIHKGPRGVLPIVPLETYGAIWRCLIWYFANGQTELARWGTANRAVRNPPSGAMAGAHEGDLPCTT